MQNQNVIDISSVPIEYQKLAFDFIDFLKLKNSKNTDNHHNYDKKKLLSTFKKASKIDIFSNIENSVTWQSAIRDDR